MPFSSKQPKRPTLIPKSDWKLIKKLTEQERLEQETNESAHISHKPRPKTAKGSRSQHEPYFNPDIKITVLIRNITTCSVRILSSYLPSIFCLDDIDPMTLTIKPSNPKTHIFRLNPRKEKIISIAVYPTPGKDTNKNTNKDTITMQNAYIWLKSAIGNDSYTKVPTESFLNIRAPLKLPPITIPIKNTGYRQSRISRSSFPTIPPELPPIKKGRIHNESDC